MKKNVRIKLRRKTQAQTLIGIILILPFLFFLLMDLLHFPSGVKYICDVAWLGLLLLLMVQRKRGTASLRRCIVVVLGFLMITLVIYLTKMQSPLYYLWGVRNNFRFYVAFVACAYFLQEEDIRKYLDMFDWVFWINALVCLVQYTLMGKRQDYLGGIFGVERGCNAYTNIFFVIVITKSLLFYLSKRETASQCGAKCVAALIIAAWAELKFFFVELIVILVAAVLLTDFTWKKVMVTVGGAAGILLSAALLGKLFPEFQGFLSLEAMLSYATNTKGYTGRGDLNRLTVIPQISERFLTTPLSRLVGLGLGNCDVSSFSFLTTPFYTRYSYLRYSWFSTAFLFLEMGYLGLVFFFGFFVVVYFEARKQAKASTNTDSVLYCQMAMIVAVCAAMIGVYNSSLRTEAGYMAYFVLSFPYIVGNRRHQDRITREVDC